MKPNGKGFFSSKAFLPSKKDGSTNKIHYIERHYEHQIYTIWIGYFSTKEIISTRRPFSNFNNNSTRKKEILPNYFQLSRGE
jgi:hypothetical protein